MQLMMPADFSLPQGVPPHFRVCEKRSTKRAVAECRDATPWPAQVLRVENGVRENDRCIPTIENHLAHQNARCAGVREEKTFVAIGTPHALEDQPHAHARTALGDACRKRAAVRQPWTITAGRNRSRRPEDVARESLHWN